MKKKTFAFVLAAAVLGLAACGNNGNGKDASKSASKPAPTSSTSKAPSSSRQPVKSAEITNAAITAKESKAYLTFEGTSANIEAADIKIAVGLFEMGTGTTDDEGKEVIPANWILGVETPTDADYKYTVTLDAQKAFKLEIALTDIANIKGANYSIFVGIKGYQDYGKVSTSIEESSASDSKNRYYTRNDIQGADGLVLCVSELPPVALTSATVIKENGKLKAKIGGATTKTLEELKAYNSFMDFQCIEQYSKTRIYQNTGETSESNYYYDWVIEGGNAYVKADISFMQPGRSYATHFSVTKSTDSGDVNCFMADDMQDQTFSFEEENLKFVVHAKPSAGQAGGGAEFWGCLGFIVSYINEPVVEE